MEQDKIKTILAARDALWKKGNLSWKLDANQKVCYDTYKTSKHKVQVWNLARSSGKSFLLCIIAIEECLKNPKAQVKFCCPTQKMATTIIRPLFRDILEGCPKELKPEWIKGEGAYRFPNGAIMILSGLNAGRAEDLRGGSDVLDIVDEAGHKSLMDLKYIVESVLIPCVTRTKDINGKIILASSAPLSASHPFVHFLRQAELNGAAITRTVYTNPRLTEQMMQDIIASCGGSVETTTFKREYLCHIITDTDFAVVPDFTDEVQERIVKEWKRPPFFDAYVSMDIGFKDLTVALFGYYDFRNAKLIIEDEYVINGKAMTTQVLAEAIKSKERELFTDVVTGDLIPPYLRVSDNDLIVLQDLYRLHNLVFIATKKDDKEAAVNNFRMMVASERLIINPRCKTLIRHIRDATWKNGKNVFDHSDIDKSHFDALDAAVYLVRNVNFNKNPYPANYGLTKSDSYFQKGYSSSQSKHDWALAMMNMKKKT